MRQGDLIGVSDGPRHQLGVVLDTQERRVTVALGLHRRRQTLSARQVQLIWPLEQAGGSPPHSLAEAPWSFGAEAVITPNLLRRDVAATWLLLLETPEPLALLDWAALLCPALHPLQAAGLWLWLQSDQLWFQSRQERVSARPPAELRQLRNQRRRQQLALQDQLHWHQQLQRREPLQIERLGAIQQGELEHLKQWAAGDSSTPLPEALQQALRRCGTAVESSAIRHLLVDLGQWDAHALPALRQSLWAHGFQAELEAYAAALLASADEPRPGDETRSDRCNLHCVTIDDEDTHDIDDGLSLEQRDDGGVRLWIHVADPGRLITEGDPLDLEARRRASSLYLARGIEPMFPWELSCRALSLRAGQRNAAWSIWVELAADGSVAASGLERSWVRPAYRLSYADADELLELAPPQEAALVQMHLLLEQRRRWRKAQGALLLDQPEGRIRCHDLEPKLEITEPSASRLLVAEAMILAGAVVAAYGAAHGLALPYRCQLPSPLPDPAQLQALPPGPVRHAALKQGLSRGLTHASAAPHFSLGLEAYVQVTSPIRRYGDLLVQRQLALLLAGSTPLDQAAVQDLLGALVEPQRQANHISRDDQRHWRQVWFAAHRSGQWPGVFLRWLRESDQLGLIWLDALAMELPAQCPHGSQPGDGLLVKVHRVDPLQDCLQLRAHR